MRICLCFCLLTSASVWAGDWKVTSESLFAVITHKGGVAKGMAHNHFIYASKNQATLFVDPDDLSQTRIQLSFPVADLVVDDAAVSARWFPTIVKLDILEESFAEVKEKSRGKIRKAMLGKKQLNAVKFGQIQAKLLQVQAKSMDFGGRTFTHELRIEVTILGQTVTYRIPGNLSLDGDLLKLEAVGLLKFSDFAMKPYSAMMGAVSNLNEFHLYVNMQARQNP